MERVSIARRALFASVPAIILLGGLFAAERYLRGQSQSQLTTTGQVMEPDPTRIWRLKAGESQSFGATHHIDSDGLRITQDDGHANRILTLGDSSIYGHGLSDSETLHAYLEGELQQARSPTDVLCGGVPGYSSEQALVLLDEVGWSKEPDLLVIGSLYSDYVESGFTDQELMAASALPSNRFKLWLSGLELVQLFVSDDTQAGDASQFVRVGWMDSLEHSGEPRVPIDRYYDNLHAMADQAQQRDVGVVFFHLCARWLYEDLRGNRTPSFTSYKQVMERVAQERGVPFVEGCQVLKGAKVPYSQAFLDGLHPTSMSNQVYAHGIAQALVDGGWPHEPLVPSVRGPR